MLKIITTAFFIFHTFAVAHDSEDRNSPTPYNHKQKEIKQFIEKRRQTNTLISNNLEYPIEIKLNTIKYEKKFIKTIQIEPKQHYTCKKTLISATIKTHKDKTFLKLEESVDQRYNLVLTNREKEYRPKFIPRMDFTPKFLGDYKPRLYHTSAVPYGPRYQINPPQNLDEHFTTQYNNHLQYLIDVIFFREKIDSTEYFKKLNDLDSRYYFPHLYNDSLTSTSDFRIPRIIHTVWLTSPDKPIEFPTPYINYLLKSVEACSPKQRYRHILWVNNKFIIPQTVARFARGPVELRMIKQLGKFTLKKEFKYELAKKRFGKASDIIRLVILEKMGGIYKDTDYRIHQSIDPLLKCYDFIAGREPMSSFICNAFIAAKPQHPVIQKYLSLIKRNYAEAIPSYIKDIPESDGFKTILVTGPGLFTVAVGKEIGTENNRDIILSEEYIYPTPVNTYPQIKVVKAQEAVPAPAFGAHYWLTSWVSEEFGSVG